VIQATQTVVLVEGLGIRFGVMDASLACCALESRSALRASKPWEDEILDGLVLLVSGTISQKLAKPLLDLAAQFASISVEIPHFLVAVGACATSGGPYWDSDSIVAGVDALGLSCDLYIPGCPPRPSEILSGLVGLLDQVHVQ
jgi:NADH-quinone oxidoreductase subunit B